MKSVAARRGAGCIRSGALIALVFALPVLAAEPEGSAEVARVESEGSAEVAAVEPEGTAEVDVEVESADSRLRLEWGATLIGQGKVIAEREATDSVGGFFDQYEYTPNKGVGFPIELGVRDARIDLLGEDDHPIFRLRLESPTSNLGVSGSGISQPFFNQRIDTATRGLSGPGGGVWAIDLDYARMRTEELRRFPDTGGAALVFDDYTAADDRFFRDRTGFDGELRHRRAPAAPPGESGGVGLVSELAVRGGYQARDGLGQRRAHRDPVNDWLGLPEPADRSVSDVGAGLLFGSSGGGVNVTLDYDYERLRWQSSHLYESDLGASAPAANRPIGYVPDTDRSTANVGASGRVGREFRWNLGYQLSIVEQVGSGTLEQQAADFGENRVTTHSANGSLGWRVADHVTLRARADFDYRDDEIDRTSSLFNPTGGVQIDPFVEDWRRISAEVEGEWRFLRRNTVTLGLRYDDTHRSLDFAEPGGVRILPENALVAEDTRTVEVFAKTRLRPWRRLRLKGELGYRAAPETGYVTDLDNFVHGRIDARYTFATKRPLAMTAFVRGDSGGNDDFEMVDGLAPDPNRPRLGRRFDRWQIGWGVGLEASPVDRLSVFASFLCGRLRQKSGLVLSNYQRYYQESGAPPGVGLTFTDVGLDDFMNERKSLILGVQHDWSSRFDTGGAYTYSRARAIFEGGGNAALDLLSARRGVDMRTQVLDLEGGWRPAEGLRVLTGYRLQWNRDDFDAPTSNASSATPIDRSTHQHTITLGVQIDGRFFERDS